MSPLSVLNRTRRAFNSLSIQEIAMSKRLFAALFLLALLSISALAQDAPPMPPPGGFQDRQMQFRMPTFAELDKNKDKKLTRDEMPNAPPQIFDSMDQNKDGVIDEEEFGRLRNFRAGGGPRMGESLVKALDANSDGKISRDEFAKVLSLFDSLDQDHSGELSQDELNNFFRAINEAQTKATGGVNTSGAFASMDKNKDGKITADETDEKMFRNLDLNKDGSVTKEEFEKAVKQLADRSKAQSDAKPQAQSDAGQKKP
jgi:Ca2+-binding EF-hand superfamily protein